MTCRFCRSREAITTHELCSYCDRTYSNDIKVLLYVLTDPVTSTKGGIAQETIK